MKRYIILQIATLLALLPLTAQVMWSEPITTDMGGGRYNISTTAKIDNGWHIYGIDDYDNAPISTSLSLTLPTGVELVGGVKSSTPAVKYYDELFEKEIGYYNTELTLSQEILVQHTTHQDIGITVEWMSCSQGECMPPQEVIFELPTPSAQTMALWRAIVEAILWGLAALLTPCVFPMVPMTISYFVKSEGGRWRALLYGVFIVLLYTLPIAVVIVVTYIVGGDAVMGDIFNFLSTHWLPNLIFFAIFILFAASFLGAFELTLPSSWVNRSDRAGDKGGVVGVFFLALTLVLVSFSCTGPIVGSVVISSTRGEFWMPILTMFIFSLSFALPFMLLALFPSALRSMPKSGGWLASVKIVLGFLEIALALKFLSVADQTYHWGILSREIYLAIWIVTFTLLGLYLLGKIRFKGDAEASNIGVVRLFLAIATLSFVVYILPGMWGAPLPALSGYLPPPSSVERGVKEIQYYGLSRGEADAREQQKPMLVYLTGYGCVNCRAMEQRVWSNPEVRRILDQKYIVVPLYMDDKRELPQNEWVKLPNGRELKSIGRINSHMAIERWGVNAQPYYIVVGLNGEELLPPRGYDLSVEGYVEFLNRGVENFNKIYKLEDKKL